MTLVLLLLASLSRASAQEPPDAEAVQFSPGVELLAAYRANVRDDVDPSLFHQVELDRGFAWLAVAYQDANARVLLEAVRSANESALVGVAGNSLVARVREAWASYTFFDRLTLAAGVVPLFTQTELVRVEGLRPLGEVPIRRYGLTMPTDLGLRLALELPAELGTLGISLSNGEGYDQAERNRGKNVELFASIHPLSTVRSLAPLTVVISYVNGSSGTGSAAADRASAALAWDDEDLRGGLAFVYGAGYLDDGTRDAFVASGFVRARLFDRLLLGGRVAYVARDVDESDDSIVELLGAVGAEIVPGVEAHGVVRRSIAGSITEAALPGIEAWELSAVLRASLGDEVPGG